MSDAIIAHSMNNGNELLSEKGTSTMSFDAASMYFNQSDYSNTKTFGRSLRTDISYLICKMEFNGFDPIANPTSGKTSTKTVSFSLTIKGNSTAQTIFSSDTIEISVGGQYHFLPNGLEYQTMMLDGKPISGFSTCTFTFTVIKNENWAGTVSWPSFTINVAYY